MIARSLIVRWTTPKGEQLAREVLVRLTKGKPIAGLPLDQHEGRVDLRGLPAPLPTRKRPHVTPRWFIHELGDFVEIKRGRLENLDLSGSRLDGWRFFESEIVNCRFDNARCQDWRLWATNVTDTSFVSANLRQAVLGPWYKGRGNLYHRCVFSHADLYGIVSTAATFMDCDFLDVRLEKVEFDGTGFVRCRFSGRLREVMFYARSLLTEKPDPNPMEDIDFTQAELSMVDFRGLNLDHVRFPKGDNYVLIRHYHCVLEQAIQVLSRNQSARDRAWRSILEDRLKWIGPHQAVGLFNRHDYAEMSNNEDADFLIDLLKRCEAGCTDTPRK